MTEIMTSLYALLDDALTDLKEAQDWYGSSPIHSPLIDALRGEVEGIRKAIEIVKGEVK